MKLSDLAESNRENDRAIQMALRETDVEVMSDFLADVRAEEREIIYRNMSERAGEMLKQEVAQKEGTLSPGRMKNAREFVLQRLSRFVNYVQRDVSPLPDSPPALDVSTDEGLVESLLVLVRFARVHGMLSLESVVKSVEHPIARNGMQMTVDGWDPIEKRAILDRMKRTYLECAARTIDILIEGFDCLGSQQHPQVIEEKLRAHLPSAVHPLDDVRAAGRHE